MTAIPASLAAAGLCSAMGLPSASSVPLSGWCTPARILTSVDLPAPFSPTSPCAWPACSSIEPSASACTAPNAFAACRSDSSSAPGGLAQPAGPAGPAGAPASGSAARWSPWPAWRSGSMAAPSWSRGQTCATFVERFNMCSSVKPYQVGVKWAFGILTDLLPSPGSQPASRPERLATFADAHPDTFGRLVPVDGGLPLPVVSGVPRPFAARGGRPGRSRRCPWARPRRSGTTPRSPPCVRAPRPGQGARRGRYSVRFEDQPMHDPRIDQGGQGVVVAREYQGGLTHQRHGTRPGRKARDHLGGGSAEAVDEVVVHLPHLARQVAVEGAEVLGNKRCLSFPGGGVDREQDIQIAFADAQAVGVECSRRRQVADRAPDGPGLAGKPFHDPLQDPDVLAVARPQELAVLILSEPVDVEDARQLAGARGAADLQPVSEVVAHVVTTERQHREGIMTQLTDLALGGRGLLRGNVRAEEDSMSPVEGFGDERHGGRAPAAEQNRRDRDTLWVVPFRCDDRALGDRSGET